MKRTISLFLIFISIVIFLYARNLTDILDSDKLIVAIRNIPSEVIYFPKNQESPGFCYELAKGFAERLGVKLEIFEVKKFSEYFEKNLFQKVDLIADILTVTEKRKQIIEMVPFVENTELFFGRMDLNIKNVEDLKGKRIVTFESFSYYKTLLTLLDSNGINYVINRYDNDLKTLSTNPVPKDSVEILLVPSGVSYSPYFVFMEIIEDRADVSIFDSFSFVQKYYNAVFLMDHIKPLFPATDKIGYLAFGFEKDNRSLAREFSEYLDEIKKNAEFDKLFEKYMKISYTDYLKLLEVNE